MVKDRKDESPREQGRRNTNIRRETAVRGSMGTPASGRDTQRVTPETDVFKEQAESGREHEDIRGGGGLKETRRKLGETVEKIGKRIKS
jgi:hypothetical protein